MSAPAEAAGVGMSVATALEVMQGKATFLGDTHPLFQQALATLQARLLAADELQEAAEGLHQWLIPLLSGKLRDCDHCTYLSFAEALAAYGKAGGL